jgi:hypothetical protein
VLNYAPHQLLRALHLCCLLLQALAT